MRSHRWISLTCLVTLVALVFAGCGSGSSQQGFATITVDAIDVPLSSAGGSAFVLTCTNVLSAVGTDVIIRFRAETGTPFAGGTSATADVPGTVTSSTTVTGLSPVAGLASFNAFVGVILPSLAAGESTTPLAMFFGGPPMPMDDTYDAVGNVRLDVPAGTGLLANDTPPGLLPVTNTAALTATTMGGALTVNADGSFTYDPPIGFEGIDTFVYEVDGGTASATATITVADVVWFIDSDAAAGGTGRDSDPFQTIAEFNAINGGGGSLATAADYIFLFNRGAPYAGNLTLQSSQRLIGQGVDLVVGGNVLVSAGLANTDLQASSGTAVTVGLDNTIRGVDIANSAGRGILGPNVGALTIDTCTLDCTNGTALDIANATAAAVSLDAVSVDNTAFPAPGIALTNNTGSIALTGLTLATSSGPALLASSGGVLTVTGATNTVSSTTGRALDLTGTTFGAAGVTFQSVSANGAPSGISIVNSGTLGSLTVTGDGSGAANGSGGTIQNTTGPGISITNSVGVSLSQLDVTSTASHGFDLLQVTNLTYQDALVTNAGTMDDEHGMRLTNLFGTSLLDNVTFDGINEDGIEIRNDLTDDATTDTLTITGCTFLGHTAAGFAEHAIDIQSAGVGDLAVIINGLSLFQVNANGALGVLGTSVDSSTLSVSIDDCDFDALNAFGSGQVTLIGTAFSAATFNVTNSRFTDGGFTAIIANCDDTATVLATITGNTIDHGASNGGFGISLRQDEDGTLTALVDSNTIQDTGFDGIVVRARDGTLGTGTCNATITNNTLSTAPATFGAGITLTSDDDNTLCANISGNSAPGSGTFTPLDDDIYIDADDTSVMNITQASAIALGAANTAASVGIGTGTGTINFGAVACPTP